MRRVNWMAAIASVGLCGVAAAQVSFESLPRVFDATMPRDQQIALALSAGPEGVRSGATVYVLAATGYEKAREGSNGVTCLVGRHFVKPTETTIEPMCYDPEGTRTLLPVELYREELRSKGVAEDEIKADVAARYKDGRFKAPGRSGVLYMLSSDNRLGPTPDHGTAHFPGHFMFYAPYMTGKDLGYDSTSAAAPYMTQPGEPDNLMVVVPDSSMQ
jgi:hypothetical protein